MENMKTLVRQLFYDYQDTEEYMKESEGHRRSYDRAYKFFVKLPEDEEMFIGAIVEREDFAFSQGVKFAFNFMRECEKL